MKIFSGFFVLLMFLICANVEAASNSEEIIFQELKTRIIIPTPPERIRHRQDGRRLQRPSPPRRRDDFPRRSPPPPRRESERHTQRQPKRPAPIYRPQLPHRNSPQRGSRPHKKFGPPRF